MLKLGDNNFVINFFGTKNQFCSVNSFKRNIQFRKTIRSTVSMTCKSFVCLTMRGGTIEN